MSRVRITIGQLVLKGFDPGPGKAVAEALQAELGRALSSPAAGKAMQAQQMPVLRLGPIPLASGNAGGRALGKTMGATIGRRLKS